MARAAASALRNGHPGSTPRRALRLRRTSSTSDATLCGQETGGIMGAPTHEPFAAGHCCPPPDTLSASPGLAALPRRQVLLLDRGDDDVVRVDHLGHVQLADL